MDGGADLIVAAVNALPSLLDAAERAERAEARVRELLAAAEAFSGPDCGTVFDGRDSLCGGCGIYRDDQDPAAHDAECPRLAARQLAARIRAEVSRG